MKTLKTFKSQAGMTLTESLLVLGVGALVAVLAYGGYKMATSDVKVQSQVNGTVQLIGKIKQLYSSAANYNGLTTAVVVNSKIVPSDFKTVNTSGSEAINNAWGGTVAVAPANSDTQFTLTISSVPQQGCIEFLSGIAGTALTLTKNGTAAANTIVASGAFDATKAATQCATAGDVILTAQ